MPYARQARNRAQSEGAMEASMTGQQATSEPRAHLGAGGKWVLAVLCLAAGIAPLAARWIPGDVARFVYGLLVAGLLLGLTLLGRRAPALRRYRDLGFGFFVFAVVQVLNNSIPRFVATSILHQPPTSGNPLASTVLGSVVIQLLDTAIA